MRLLILLLLCSIAATTLSAQITITEQDVLALYKTGHETTSGLALELGTTDIGQPGGGNVWDFSGVTFTESVPWSTIDPEDGVESENFPTADACVATTFAEQGLTFEVWSYFTIDGGLFELGTTGKDPTEGLTLVTTVTPPNQLMPLPVTYQATWTSDYTSVTKINGMTFNTTVYREETVVDAYGTLILPDGSSQEALRIKNVQSSSEGSSTSFFFIAKNGAQLGIEAEVDDPGNSGEISVLGANYHPGLVQVSVDEDDHTVVGTISNHPNPASSSTTLVYTLLQPGVVTISVYDVEGRMVLRTDAFNNVGGTHELSMPCEHLLNGVYTVRLTCKGSSVDHRIVIQH